LKCGHKQMSDVYWARPTNVRFKSNAMANAVRIWTNCKSASIFFCQDQVVTVVFREVELVCKEIEPFLKQCRMFDHKEKLLWNLRSQGPMSSGDRCSERIHMIFHYMIIYQFEVARYSVWSTIQKLLRDRWVEHYVAT
jgi:hypothetical protein